MASMTGPEPRFRVLWPKSMPVGRQAAFRERGQNRNSAVLLEASIWAAAVRWPLPLSTQSPYIGLHERSPRAVHDLLA